MATATLGTAQKNLETVQGNLEFTKNQLDKYLALLAFEEDPVQIQNYQDEVDALNADITDYEAKISEYQSIITQETADAAVADGETTATNPSGPLARPYTEDNGDGSTTTYYEDGSTLTTNADGTTSSTDATPDAITPPEDPTNGAVSPVGPAYDDDGNLYPGWTLDENGDPVYVGGDFVEPATQASADQSRADATEAAETGTRSMLPKGGKSLDIPGAMAQWSEAKDLRVKLRVPPSYLVGPAAGPANIIQKNGGILFPYTPTISVDNQASYSQQSPLHSNYPLYFYKNS
jgi:hypothetical protein